MPDIDVDVERRYARVTAQDNGPIANIIAWFLLVTAILSVFVRLVIKRLARAEKFSADDILIVAALFLYTTQVILVSQQVDNGLGRNKLDLDSGSRHALQKLQYVSDVLYLFIFLATKYVTLELLRKLGGHLQYFESVIYTSVLLSGIWWLSGVFTVGFQCGARGVWSTHTSLSSCVDMVTFWKVMGTFNILLEVPMLALPIYLVWGLRVHLAKKAAICCAFGFRLSVVGAVIVQIIEVRGSNPASIGVAGADVGSVVATECALAFTIITACAPLLKPFLDAFHSGALGASLRMTSSSRFPSIKLPSILSSARHGHPPYPEGGEGEGHEGSAGRGLDTLEEESEVDNILLEGDYED